MWTLVVAVPDPVPILKMPCCLRVVLASFGPLLLFLLLLLICSDPLDPLDPLLQVTESEEETSPYRFPFPFLYAQEAELPEYGSDQEEEDRSSKRVRRDHLEPRDKKDYSAPGKRLLDNIIHRKIETMTVKIVIALNALRAKIKHNNLKKYTQGWSILIGSWKDIFSKWNLANYTIDSVTTLYDYGFLASYGVGFGGPLLLQQVIDPNIDCGLQDFRILIDRYDLQGGVRPFFPSVNKSSVFVVNSKVDEFASVARARLNCILEHDQDLVEAAEVGWNLDEVVRAMKMRLSYEVDFPTLDED